jgi:hypothetical protein
VYTLRLSNEMVIKIFMHAIKLWGTVIVTPVIPLELFPSTTAC